MTEKIANDAREFADYARSQPKEEREQANLEGMAQAKAEYEEFVACFHAGKCSVCGDDLSSFNRSRPCLHWLLVPAGFTKHHFMAIARRFGIFPMQLFLRRVANQAEIGQNINDLCDEGTGKLIELTIRWGECEWAFSCSEGDYKGHDGASEDARRPHYHFQMRRKKQAFIRYNDFHVPLSQKDIFLFEAKRAAPDFVHHMFAGGESMSDLMGVLTPDNLGTILSAGHPAKSEKEATLRLQTIIKPKNGSMIDGDELQKIIDEAREKNVPMASIARKLSDATVHTIVSPGEGVVDQAPRSGGRGGKQNNST